MRRLGAQQVHFGLELVQLAAQLAIAPWLSQRLGIGLMLLLAPLGAVVVAVWVGLQPGLIVVLVAQAATRVFDKLLKER